MDVQTSRERAVEAMRTAMAIAESAGREDLVARLVSAGNALMDPAVTVFVAGEFKKGKSSLVNALLDVELCAVDDHHSTAVPTFLRFSAEAIACAVHGSGAQQQFERVEVDDAAALTSETDDTDERPTSLVIGVPRRLLEDGLVIVDTPGVGGLDSRHGIATMSALSRAQAVLFVSDASQELTATERDFLLTVHRACPTVALVMTKIDINPAWRKIVDINRGHLRRAGVDAPILPVASPLRRAALESGDAELNSESGFQALTAFLRERVLDQADDVAAAAAAAEIQSVGHHLGACAQAELAALQDGGQAQIEALEAATARAEQLRAAGGRWQVALNDGLTDLSADLDHEVRTRIRGFMKDAEGSIDKTDPARSWGELAPMLNQRITAEVMACYALLEERVQSVSIAVAELFRLDEEDVAAPIAAVAGPAVDLAKLDRSLDIDASSLGKDAFSALRGLQGGVMLFGMVAQMAGLALTGPAAIAIGVVMGGKTLREERKRQLTLRRQQAKVPIRKCADDIQLLVGKDTKDRLREAHRALRDSFTERAQVLHRSSQEALRAAQRAAGADAKWREQRRPEVERELGALQALHAMVREMGGR